MPGDPRPQPSPGADERIFVGDECQDGARRCPHAHLAQDKQNLPKRDYYCTRYRTFLDYYCTRYRTLLDYEGCTEVPLRCGACRRSSVAKKRFLDKLDYATEVLAFYAIVATVGCLVISGVALYCSYKEQEAKEGFESSQHCSNRAKRFGTSACQSGRRHSGRW